jgi:hypothetical protein
MGLTGNLVSFLAEQPWGKDITGDLPPMYIAYNAKGSRGAGHNPAPTRSDKWVVTMFPDSKLVVIEDAMNRLYQLRLSSFHPPATPAPGTDTTGATVYAPTTIYESVVDPILKWIACEPFLHTYVLVFDKPSCMPLLKQVVQVGRDSGRKSHPYPLPPPTDGLVTTEVVIDDFGLRVYTIDTTDNRKRHLFSNDANINMCRLMATRRARTALYAYIASRLQQDTRMHGYQMIVDYDQYGPYLLTPPAPSSSESNNQKPGGRACIKELHNQCGEGEVAAVRIALHFGQTHHVLVASGDSDLFAISLPFVDRFRYSFFVGLRKPLYFNMRRVPAVLKENNWSLNALLLACILNGTDFVDRSRWIYRIPKQTLFAAVHHIVDKCNRWPLRGEHEFESLTHEVYTRHLRVSEDLLYDKPIGSPQRRSWLAKELEKKAATATVAAAKRRKTQPTSSHPGLKIRVTRGVMLPDPDILFTVLDIAKQNWDYWNSLQDTTQALSSSVAPVVLQFARPAFMGQPRLGINDLTQDLVHRYIADFLHSVPLSS